MVEAEGCGLDCGCHAIAVSVLSWCPSVLEVNDIILVLLKGLQSNSLQ
jgi:hypothetical protein